MGKNKTTRRIEAVKYIAKAALPSMEALIAINASKRRWRIAIVSVSAVLIWWAFAFWLMTFSKRHEWLSSFVEVSFALNVALSFPKMQEVIRDLRNTILEEGLSNRGKSARETLLTILPRECLSGLVEVGIEVFDRRCKRDLDVYKPFSRVCAFMAIVVLLTDCSGALVYFLPLLLSPMIFLGVGILEELIVLVNDIIEFLKKPTLKK